MLTLSATRGPTHYLVTHLGTHLGSGMWMARKGGRLRGLTVLLAAGSLSVLSILAGGRWAIEQWEAEWCKEVPRANGHYGADVHPGLTVIWPDCHAHILGG